MNCAVNNVKVPICFLLIIFAWSSWIDINGLWVELPQFVNSRCLTNDVDLILDQRVQLWPRKSLPEGWSLPAYLTAIIQLANLGPLLYGFLKWLLERNRSQHINKLQTAAIYTIMIIGCISVLLLSFFWNKTTFIRNVEHSTALLVLTFFLATVDCTSSVTFLPFMAHLKPQYLTAFYIGEGMSGVIPTAVAFLQGAGEYTCENITNNGTWSIQPKYSPLLFPVSDFFIAMFIMLVMSVVAYSMLKYMPYCRKEYSISQNRNSASTLANKSTDDSSASLNETNIDYGTSRIGIALNPRKPEDTLTVRQFIVLLITIAFINGLSNGALPSVQTYSLLPYGQIYYSLAVKLSTLANPLACFLAFFIMTKSMSAIATLTLMSTICAAYILTAASFSPEPLIEGAFAAVIMVIVWIIFVSLTSYLKVVVANSIQSGGQSSLFWLGVATQIGSFLGAMVTFLCVTVFKLLTGKEPCT